MGEMLCWLSAPRNHGCENISEGRCDHRFGGVELAFGKSIKIVLRHKSRCIIKRRTRSRVLKITKGLWNTGAQYKRGEVSSGINEAQGQ